MSDRLSPVTLASAALAGRVAPRRTARIAFTLLLALGAAGGCTKLLYNRLDSMAGWYLQNLVSLDRDQSTDLRSWLERTLDWHRQSELTRYSRFLRSLSHEVSEPGTRADYERAEQQIQAFLKAIAAKAAPDAARLLVDLSPPQVEELAASLEEKARERADEAAEEVEAGKWHEQRAKALQRQLKRWTGSVTNEQKALVQDRVSGLQPTYAEWLDSQRRWRSALQEELTSVEAPETKEQRILRLLSDADSEWTPQYASKLEHNRAQTLALLEALDPTLTPAQRERLQRELTRLAQQLEVLAEG